MNKNSKIYIAGHTGLVGSAIKRRLEAEGYTNLLYRTSKELDLTDSVKVSEFLHKEKPEYIFLAAAKVAGIIGNKTYPADYLVNNLKIQNNIIPAAHDIGVKKLLFLGSTCIYPKMSAQPIKEEYVLTGPLEQSNEGYAIAKLAGLMMCKKYHEQYGDVFISAMPSNVFGINDNFHPTESHVLQGIMRRMHEAKLSNSPEVVIWGTGKPLREYILSDDLADGLIFLMKNYSAIEHINVGTGKDLSVKEIAETVKAVVGYKGKLVFDTTKPDGTPRKISDVTKINNLGWKSQTNLEEGVKVVYEWMTNNWDWIKDLGN